MSESADLVAVERVRCLDCGTGYLKPCRGATARRHAGCPRCGYLGWISATVPVNEGERPRFVEGRQQHPYDQLR